MARGRIADLIEVQGLRADLLLLTSEVVTRAVELGEVARADDDAGAAGEFEEDGEEGHGRSG